MEPDTQNLLHQLDQVNLSARQLTAGLSESQATTRPSPAAWSVSECLDHLAVTNLAYLDAMRPAAARARTKNRLRRGPATPGPFGRWFLRQLEPPVKPGRKWKAPASLQPAPASTLAQSTSRFLDSQQQVAQFLQQSADLDLAHITFPNPILPVLRFSLATGLSNLCAHARRHLWQARESLAALPPKQSAQ